MTTHLPSRPAPKQLLDAEALSRTLSRIAHEQAAFSSRREELCRNYQRETEHGAQGPFGAHVREISRQAL